MPDTVKLTIDDVEYEVPAGMNLVDAAKLCGIDIPVFCYHPKLGHDGNCRMCLVELGMPRPTRETGEMELAWAPTLQTACTQTVSESLAIRTTSQKVIEGRRAILEFLLASHPLDCPICDKGGECPLQNLTMRHGPGTSRMYWEDKMHLGKHVSLGELIFLDQERCIHCARCIRFQEMIADDPVLSFNLRGRKQQIITDTEPGFDSIFSGNTTDICPVGALTTADFRFNARPWEMVQVATVCSHCPVGCNMSFDTRTDREAGGRTVIKRVMPRQNEWVNEIWICDKGRFSHHYMEHPDRLKHPLVRKRGELIESTWEEALDTVVAHVKGASKDIAALAGGRLSNEDFFAVQKLIRAQGSHNLAVSPPYLAGGEWVARYGVGSGSNLLDMGAGDAIVVVASDLHQEAPVWWLRVIAAAKRGADVVVINGRQTRLDKFAMHCVAYTYGEEVATLNGMLGCLSKSSIKPGRHVGGLDEAIQHAKAFEASKEAKAAAKAISEAENVIVLVGGEGLDAHSSPNLTQAAANLLVATGHIGRANNGLILVWPSANGQGAADMGFHPNYTPGYQPVSRPGLDYAGIFAALKDNGLRAVYIVGADPAFDDPAAEKILRDTKAIIVVQDMFLTATASLADVVLPAQSLSEREGSYTSGERRVQRFYPAIEPMGESRPDWLIAQQIGERLGQGAPKPSVATILLEIAETVPQYKAITYRALAQIAEQFPDVGGEDPYYGGTAFQNFWGLGVQWPVAAEDFAVSLGVSPVEAGLGLQAGSEELIVVPITLLYDTEAAFHKTDLLHERVSVPHIGLNPADAHRLGVQHGEMLAVTFNGYQIAVVAYVDSRIPDGVGTLPRRLQSKETLQAATVARIGKLEKAGA